MNSFLVGCVPITWNAWKRAAPQHWPQARVLAEIAQAGFEGVSSGPREGQSAAEVAAYLSEFGLRPAPGYLGGEFWQPESLDAGLGRARRQAEFSQAVGVSELFVAPTGGDYRSRRNGQTRRQLAGRVAQGDGLSDEEYEVLAGNLSAIGRATLEFGVRLCLHNHLGQVIETRLEVDRLVELMDEDAVFLGPDTGHLAWAAADVTQFFRDYAPRIKTLHLKEINPEVRRRGVEAGWDYPTFSRNGIFAEPGEGETDFPELFRILSDAGFSGWVLSETDVTQKSTALESATLSRNYLRELGI